MMLKSSLCDDSNVYIFVKGTLKAPNTAVAVAANNNSISIVFKNCAPFTDCIS